jgi:hypothetical protein
MKSISLRFAATVIASLLPAPTFAHQDDAAPRGAAAPGYGRVLFTTSCSPAAQKQFERALGMLHSFYFPETVKAFAAIPETDPSCAIAYWGLAISQRPNPLVGPFDAAALKRGWDAVEKGRAVGAKTARERDWIEAIGAFYQDYDKVDQDTRTANYERAMEALARKYPNDVEATVFYALALNESASHGDKTFAKQLKAAKLLEPIDRKYPDHPGVTHYIIHSLDYAPLAQRALPAANKYGEVAPAAPHALHMPSHIYSMLGLWQNSIEANWKTIASSNDYAAKNHPDKTYPAIMHSADFIQYAYLQLGEDAKAKALMDEIAGLKPLSFESLPARTAMAAIPARYMLERQDWRGAAQLKPMGSTYPAAEAITHFARAIGAARAGDAAAAQADIDRLMALRAALEKASQSYWAEQVEVQILAAQAWLAQAQSKPNDAAKLMRAAADLEDASEKHVAMENRLYPMRELLADLLLAHGQAAAALTEYETALAAAPARLRGFYGAAKAAEAAGDTTKAASYRRNLAQLTRNADGERDELRWLKTRIASN